MTFKKFYDTISLLNNILQLNYKFMNNKQKHFLIYCCGVSENEMNNKTNIDYLLEDYQEEYCDFSFNRKINDIKNLNLIKKDLEIKIKAEQLKKFIIDFCREYNSIQF